MVAKFNEWGFSRLPNNEAIVTVGDSIARARMVGTDVEIDFKARVVVAPQKRAEQKDGKGFDKIAKGVLIGARPDLSIQDQVCNCVQVGVHSLAETFGCSIEVADNQQDVDRLKAAIAELEVSVADGEEKLAQARRDSLELTGQCDEAKAAADSSEGRIAELEAEIKALKAATPAKSTRKRPPKKARDDSAE